MPEVIAGVPYTSSEPDDISQALGEHNNHQEEIELSEFSDDELGSLLNDKVDKGTLAIDCKDGFGVVGDGIADDTNALRAWAAAANGKRAFWSRGNYKISGTIAFSDPSTELYGEGVRTVITATSDSISPLVIGRASTSKNDVGSATPFGVRVNGFVRDLTVTCVGGTEQNPPTPGSGSIGVQIVSAIQHQLDNVTVEGFDVAFDYNGNCYGAQMTNCRAPFSMNNVGLNIRRGPVSGADQSFINNWLGGKIAAVHIAGEGGGLHFWGGQLTGGQALSSDEDDYGVVIIGKDYFTGNTEIGGGNIQFKGVSFEGFSHMWAIRAFDEFKASFECSFNPTYDNSPIGIIKGTDLKASRIRFTSCYLGNAVYTSPDDKLAVLEGTTFDYFGLTESDWSSTSGITIGSLTNVDMRNTTLAQQAGFTTGITGSDRIALITGANRIVSDTSYASVRIRSASPFASEGSGPLGGESAYYGDGSDGDFNPTTTYTMTSDLMLNNLTLGANLVTNGYILYVRGLLTLNGFVIHNNGAGANGQFNSSSGAQAGSLMGGGAGSSGLTTTAQPRPGQFVINGGFGGSGGDGGSSVAGANPGGFGGSNGGSFSAAFGGIHKVPFVTEAMLSSRFGVTPLGGGCGGGAGAGDGTNAGGGGGQGGGVVVVHAYRIDGSVPGSRIAANGGSGAVGTGGNAGGGGGGGGGLVLVTYNRRNSFTIEALGGTGGVGAGTGSVGSSGVAGTTKSLQL